jgi:uncharacterized iron-regulated protein
MQAVAVQVANLLLMHQVLAVLVAVDLVAVVQHHHHSQAQQTQVAVAVALGHSRRRQGLVAVQALSSLTQDLSQHQLQAHQLCRELFILLLVAERLLSDAF